MLSLLDTPKEPSTTPSSQSKHATSPHPKHPYGLAKGHGKKTHGPAKMFMGAPESQPQDSSAPTTASVTQPPSKRFVLLLSIQNYDLFKNIHGHQIAAIRSRVNVKTAVTPQQAISHFASPDLAGIYLTDPGVIYHAQIMNQLEQYVKTGGLLVVGGIFSSFIRMDDIDKFFATFGLPWKRGSYQRSTFYRNDHHDTVRKNPSLASNFTMKALHVKSLPVTAAMYTVEEEESSDESMFGEGEFFGRGKAEMKEFKAPVARTHVGDGYFGYIGDVNGEKEATNIVLSMLNLLDPPPPPPKPTSRKFIMILSFESAQNMEQHYSSFFTSLKSKVEVLHGLSNERVVDLLKSSDLVGIFVMSTSIMNDENAYLLSKLVEYSKGGGTLVFGGPFSSDITIYQMRPFFMDGWGLPWDMVCGTSKEVAANPNNELIKRNHSLLLKLYTKSLFITGMTPVSAVYTVRPPSHISSSVQLAPEAPIVYATVENGHIGFIGNFNLDKKETEIVLAMFQLLK
ncbi:hypothetical protein BDQ12DRAFT_692269 [Crucibulum laeve]|uniref:Uncharacterized protein n=1 Tax=Crucibulum laeve TaxID=68775 RepID=A0A5C3LIB0_9AGAR|nr:hypothetical protein BDQ12DRAFT_692269 [Crucibulum laeve]